MEAGQTGLYMEGGTSYPTVGSFLRSSNAAYKRKEAEATRQQMGANDIPQPPVAQNMKPEDAIKKLETYGRTFGKINEPLQVCYPDGRTMSGRGRLEGPAMVSIYDAALNVNPSLPSDLSEFIMTFRDYALKHYTADANDPYDASARFVARHGTLIVSLPRSAVENLHPVSNPVYLRSYRPKYRSSPHWKVAITVATFHAITVALRAQPVEWTGPEFGALVRTTIMKAVQTYTLTNGCMQGQITRLGECWAQARLYMNRKDIDQDHYNQVVRETWPIEPVSPGTISLGDALSITALSVDKVRINMKADAGLAWSTATETLLRKDVLTSDILFNNLLIQALEYDGTPETRSAIYSFLMSQRTVKVKPKFEVIERSEFLTKTRTICVFNSFLQMPFSVWQQRIFKSQPTNATPLAPTMKSISGFQLMTYSRSLAGFNPYAGGIDNFVGACIEISRLEGIRFVCTFYSDNTYVYDSVTKSLYSLDVSKMESTSNLHEARIGIARLVNETLQNFTGEGADRLKDLLIFLGADVCHYNPGIIGDFVTSFPGLSSGSQSTFLVNHARMAYFSRLVEDAVNAQPDILLSMVAGSKKPIAVPGVTCSLNLTSVCNFQQATIDLTTGTLDQYGGIIPTDVLGHDATPVMTEYGVILCACLSRDRLIKAICFRKTDLEDLKDTTLSMEMKNACVLGIQITTMFGLFQAGAYAHSDLAYITTMCAAEAVLQFTYLLDQMGTAEQLDTFYELITNKVIENANDETDTVQRDVANSTLSILMLIVPTSEVVLQLYNARKRERADHNNGLNQVQLPEGISWIDFFDRSYVIRRFHLKTTLGRATPLSGSDATTSLVSLGPDPQAYERAVQRLMATAQQKQGGDFSFSKKKKRDDWDGGDSKKFFGQAMS